MRIEDGDDRAISLGKEKFGTCRERMARVFPHRLLWSPIEKWGLWRPLEVKGGVDVPVRKKGFDVGEKRLSRGCIGGINGMGNQVEEAQKHGSYLSELAGHYAVEWVYNHSNSIPVDVAESLLFNYQGISAPAKRLQENWAKFHEKHKSDPAAKYLQFCHSQGALHVRNALLYAPAEVRDRVIVVAIAPATIVPKSLCFDAFNYASKRDPIPYGEAALHAGLDGPPVQFIGQIAQEAHRELILLDPHPEVWGPDHDFVSPTFKSVIVHRLREFIGRYT
ncbi:MAG TPA: hypothetical protein VHA52_05945 [Candidatus Babeliaceae bacterium]|nr:hypothetical protein [Candidatus Babeliaceae bacterium]